MVQKYDYIICKNCGTTNRVSLVRQGTVRCGKCRTVIPLEGSSNGKPIQVDDGNFQREVLRARVPVLLDCWAPWCAPCRMVAPTIDQIARRYSGLVKVGKLNTDENPNITSSYGILNIPTLLIFQNGKLVDRMVGMIPRGEIEKRLSRL
jgi:thioredoxin 2